MITGSFDSIYGMRPSFFGILLKIEGTRNRVPNTKFQRKSALSLLAIYFGSGYRLCIQRIQARRQIMAEKE